MIISTLEFPAAFFGLCNVYLASRLNMWNWLFGILTTLLYIIIFFDVKLYADTGLQVTFLILQFYGFYQWMYGIREGSILKIEKISLRGWMRVSIAAVVMLSILILFLKYYTDSTTVYGDAVITTFSLIAQWMFSKKWLENWWLWILVDVISIGVYWDKKLYYTSALYASLLILAILGYYRWKKAIAPTLHL